MVGSLALLVLCAMLYMLVAVGIGLVISAVTRNQFLASQVALLASFLPSLMLSGFLFDLHNVPVAVRVVGQQLAQGGCAFFDLRGGHGYENKRRACVEPAARSRASSTS